MKVCLVTLAIGEKYLEEYNRLFRESQENYARKCGYDFRVLDDYLDKDHTDPKTITLNKILVCSQPWSAEYDFIVFIDADILINIKSPPIHTHIDFGDKIGIANETDQTPSYFMSSFRKYVYNWKDGAEYYASSGFTVNSGKILNTGVLVLQPKKHREFLERVYYKYVTSDYYNPNIPNNLEQKSPYHYEQSAVGYELQTHNMYVIISKKFNSIWFLQATINRSIGEMFVPFTFRIHRRNILTYFKETYFMHFAGRKGFSSVQELQKNNHL